MTPTLKPVRPGLHRQMLDFSECHCHCHCHCLQCVNSTHISLGHDPPHHLCPTGPYAWRLLDPCSMSAVSVTVNDTESVAHRKLYQHMNEMPPEQEQSYVDRRGGAESKQDDEHETETMPTTLDDFVAPRVVLVQQSNSVSSLSESGMLPSLGKQPCGPGRPRLLGFAFLREAPLLKFGSARVFVVLFSLFSLAWVAEGLSWHFSLLFFPQGPTHGARHVQGKRGKYREPCSGNVDYRDLCETSSKIHCLDCALYWEAGIIYYTCKCMQPTERNRQLNKARYDVLSIPG